MNLQADFGPWMVMTRKHVNHRNEVKSKVGRLTKVAANITRHSDSTIMNSTLAIRDQDPPSALTASIGHLASLEPATDQPCHSSIHNRFSTLVDLPEEALKLENTEGDTLMLPPSNVSTSATMVTYEAMLCPLGSSIPCNPSFISTRPLQVSLTVSVLAFPTLLPLIVMAPSHTLPCSLNSDSPPSSPFHPYSNSGSSNLNPDAPPFLLVELAKILTPNMSLIQPPHSPQPIPILQIALHPNTPIHWHAHLQEWGMMNQMDFPPSPPPSPLDSPDRPRRFHPRCLSTRRVSTLPQNQPSHAPEILAFGGEVLPFPIFNFLTKEELMYSVEPQLNKLVITHFPEALKTLAVSVISCLG